MSFLTLYRLYWGGSKIRQRFRLKWLSYIIAFTFLGISKDTKADFNSTNMKLSANWHPNKKLQELWNKYGPEGFELSVIKVLKYDDPSEDHTAKLESLREQCLAANPNARRIWR